MKDFNLTIAGDLGPTVLPTELTNTNEAFGKAWQNFLREIDAIGCKINDAKVVVAGKTINLPVAVHAGRVT